MTDAGTSQAINSLNETINSFKSRVDVKVNDVNVSTANIQATTNQIYANIEKFKTEMVRNLRLLTRTFSELIRLLKNSLVIT